LDNGDPIYKSRLAWCYGDLGVAAALWQAGKVTENCSWMNKALDIYRFSANRISLQDAMVNDAEICHGTAGIAMMFSYMYRQTGDPTLMTARNYWVGQTLKMSKFTDGLAGYKKFTLDDDKNVKWEESFSILEGIAGIGLMLLSGHSSKSSKGLRWYRPEKISGLVQFTLPSVINNSQFFDDFSVISPSISGNWPFLDQ
jgi:lantibiotic modifying enzyme